MTDKRPLSRLEQLQADAGWTKGIAGEWVHDGRPRNGALHQPPDAAANPYRKLLRENGQPSYDELLSVFNAELGRRPETEYDPTEEARQAFLDQVVHDEPPANRITGRLLSIAELRNLPTPEPLISGILDLDTISILYGRRGSMKSFLALDLAMCVATGTRWHTRPVTRSPVIVVAAEGTAFMAARIDAWLAEHALTTVEPDETMLKILPHRIELTSMPGALEFATAAAEYGAKFILLDTLSRCLTGADENSAKDISVAVEHLDLIRRHTGAHVNCVHHSGKDISAGSRGSSALEAGVDTVIEITANGMIVTAKTTKQKNRPEGLPITLEARTVGSSLVLGEYTGSEDTSGELLALRCLDEIAIGEGALSGEWKASFVTLTGQSDPTFYRYRKALDSHGALTMTSKGNSKRYQVSDLGALMLSPDSHGSRESQPSHYLSPPLPIGERGESEGLTVDAEEPS